MQRVGILVFVHQNALKAILYIFAHFGVVLQQLYAQAEQVGKIGIASVAQGFLVADKCRRKIAMGAVRRQCFFGHFFVA